MIDSLPLILRLAPSTLVPALLARLDADQRYDLLARRRPLPDVVNHVLADGSTRDRTALARNGYTDRPLLLRLMECGEYEVDRAVYAHHRATREMRRAIGPVAQEPVLTARETVALLRGHQRVRRPLRILDRPHVLDPETLLSEHRREPLPAGAVEALVLNGAYSREVVLALLDTRGTPAYGRWWYRAAVRAVRVGAVTPAELVHHSAPAHRTLLLATLERRNGLRWNEAERASLRREIGRVLHPVLGDRIEDWTDFGRRAHTFEGTLPELVAATGPVSATGPEVEGLSAALLDALPVHREQNRSPYSRADALKGLTALDRGPKRWARFPHPKQALAAGLISGQDVVLHGAPAVEAIDESSWLGYNERFAWPEAAAAAHDCATALARAALGEDPDAWWGVALRLPEFEGTFRQLLDRQVHATALSNR